MERSVEASPCPRARITGVVYLVYFLTAVYGEFFLKGLAAEDRLGQVLLLYLGVKGELAAAFGPGPSGRLAWSGRGGAAPSGHSRHRWIGDIDATDPARPSIDLPVDRKTASRERDAFYIVGRSRGKRARQSLSVE
jgi:hypothetical protein